MSRPRKADVDAVVQLSEPSYGVIIGYRDDAQPRYLIVRTDALGRNPRGPAFFVDSSALEPTGRISRRPGRIYRANERVFGPPEMRACACQCCVHLDEGAEPEPDDEG